MGVITQGVMKGQKNFMFIWGCRPQTGVAAKTEMVNDIIGVLMKKRNRDTLTIELPKSLEQLKGKDANFEMVTSNTIQPILLSYKHNFVTESIAYIFVNSGCKELEYKAYQDKGKNTQKLFKDILEFNQVQVFEDLSKKEIIEQLEDLKNTARHYEFENDKGSLAISITWIGFKLQASWFTPHKLLLTKLQKEVA